MPLRVSLCPESVLRPVGALLEAVNNELVFTRGASGPPPADPSRCNGQRLRYVGVEASCASRWTMAAAALVAATRPSQVRFRPGTK